MTKTFDAAAAQGIVLRLSKKMVGAVYQHYKGGRYEVTGLDVDEATGEVRVSYRSLEKKYRWSRTHANFTDEVLTANAVVSRFRRVS